MSFEACFQAVTGVKKSPSAACFLPKISGFFFFLSFQKCSMSLEPKYTFCKYSIAWYGFYEPAPHYVKNYLLFWSWYQHASSNGPWSLLWEMAYLWHILLTLFPRGWLPFGSNWCSLLWGVHLKHGGRVWMVWGDKLLLVWWYSIWKCI